MILHHPDHHIYFKEAMRLTADAFNVPQAYVEKDYFLTLALLNLSTFEQRQHVVFKSGTSLSKIYNAIYRFSEDIDLAILPSDDWSPNQIKNFLKKVEKQMIRGFDVTEDNYPKGSRFRKKRVVFPKIDQSQSLGEVKDTLLIECNAYTTPSPVEIKPTRTLIAQWALKSDRVDFIAQFQLHDFDIPVLCWKRTFCEKILGLMAAAHAMPLSDKVRHFYDITMLLCQEDIVDFVKSDGHFFHMMAISVQNDIENANGKSIPWVNENLGLNQPFNDFEQCWVVVDKAYHQEFQFMVTRKDLNPPLTEICQVFTLLKQRLVEYSKCELHMECLENINGDKLLYEGAGLERL